MKCRFMISPRWWLKIQFQLRILNSKLFQKNFEGKTLNLILNQKKNELNWETPNKLSFMKVRRPLVVETVQVQSGRSKRIKVDVPTLTFRHTVQFCAIVCFCFIKPFTLNLTKFLSRKLNREFYSWCEGFLELMSNQSISVTLILWLRFEYEITFNFKQIFDFEYLWNVCKVHGLNFFSTFRKLIL